MPDAGDAFDLRGVSSGNIWVARSMTAVAMPVPRAAGPRAQARTPAVVLEQAMASRAPSPVPEIDRAELQARLARGDRLKLVMAGSDWAFDTKRLPGSVHFKAPPQMQAALAPDDDIVVYCSNIDCHASLTRSRSCSNTATRTSVTTPAVSSTGRRPV